MLKNIKLWIVWLFIVALILFAAWLSFQLVAQSSFRDSFLGNLFATVIGVIVGIPIALEINRIQQEVQEKGEQERQTREKLSHKTRVLTLIKRELEYNRELLLYVVERQDEHPQLVTHLGLKNDTWNSFSDSGELQWVDNLELLDGISTAYYHIRNLILQRKVALLRKVGYDYEKSGMTTDLCVCGVSDGAGLAARVSACDANDTPHSSGVGDNAESPTCWVK